MELSVDHTLQHFEELLKALHQASITLSRAESIDAFLYQAVELGHNQLGFDRLGIWILDHEDQRYLQGTFGIDEHGQIRDERSARIIAEAEFRKSFDPNHLITLNPHMPLLDHESKVVGYGWQAAAGLWDGKQYIGFIGTDNLLYQQPVSAHQLEILVMYGHTIGHYYSRLRDMAEREQMLLRERRRTAELEALRVTLSEITRELDLARLLQSIIERMTDIYQANNGSIALYDADRHDLEIVAIKSNHPNTRTGLRQRLGEGATGLAAQMRRLINIPDYDTWSHPAAIVSSWKIGPVVVVPLILGDRLLGVISISRVPGSPIFDADDERLLIHFAQQATIAIHNAQLYAEAKHMAMVDQLTGLYNRHYCLDRITSELTRTQRNGRPTSIGMLDLDRFKQINDTHGHPTGDIVLREVANRMQEVVRAGDLIGRYGGEEFILLLPETNAEAAGDVADRLQRALAAIPIATEAGLLHVTASVGLVTYAGELGIGAPELIARADANLYEAKRLGRNRVVGQSMVSGS